jgi:thioredoxin-related protein
MRPSVRRLEETYSDRVDFHTLNVDNYSTTPLANQYQVIGIPMIVLLDADGEIFETYLGYMDEDALIAAVEALLDDHAEHGG